MAKKWVRLLCDHVRDRHLLPANADVEWDAVEADRMIAAGNAVELAEPPQRTAIIAPPTRPPVAPETAALDVAAEAAVQPAGRPRGRPPKARVPETVPPSGDGDHDEDEPAVNED